MSNTTCLPEHLSLDWLLPETDTTRELLRTVLEADTVRMEPATVQALWRLSAVDWQLTTCHRFSRWADAVDTPPAGFRSVRTCLATDYEVTFLQQALPLAGLRHGLWTTASRMRLDELHAAIQQRGNPFAEDAPDFLFLWPDLTRAVAQASPRCSPDELLRPWQEMITSVGRWLAEEAGVMPVLVQQGRLPGELSTSADVLMPWTGHGLRRAWNQFLETLARDYGWLVWNQAVLQETTGQRFWADPRQYFWTKLPMGLSAVTTTADSLSRVMAAACGTGRRALVLDLDNTIWGGLVGEQGTDQLILGQGDTAGEAFLAVQQVALQLKERGVLLAVCSKNDDQVAREPFRTHPEMLLQEQDIACFQANWEDKAANLKAIASTLRLGLSSLVFLDDSPSERDCVRTLTPEVAVIEPGDDPAQFATRLAGSGYFEHSVLQSEDTSRSSAPLLDVFAAPNNSDTNSYEDYLASLEMTLTFSPFNSGSRPRVTQLINKSNQFNLTTRRYNAAQVAQLEDDPERCGYAFRLSDRCGDYGIISVVILDSQSTTDKWLIDTWLMSCRVLGRGVESAVLNALMQLARQHNKSRLVGEYRPSDRNSMVATHYEQLGFERLANAASPGESDGSFWSLLIADQPLPATPIRIVHATQQRDSGAA